MAKVQTTTLHRLFQFKLTISKPFLLLGDLNLHHPWWNPMATNTSSSSLELCHFLNGYRASLLVDPEVIEEYGGTFHRSNTKNTSIIDLAFVAGFQKIQWGNWHYGESTGSDHEVILFEGTLPISTSSNSCLPPRFNTKKAKWETYTKNLQSLAPSFTSKLSQAISAREPDQVACLLQEIIIQASQTAIPKSRPSSHSKAWSTEELTNLRKDYHSKRRRAKKSWLESDIEEARISRNNYFRTISHTKKAHW